MDGRLMIIYIASPYSKGNSLANVRRQIDAAEQLASMGHVPILPLLSHYWDEVYPHSWAFWLNLCIAILQRCDAVLRLDGESTGADVEVKEAQARGMPVFYRVSEIGYATKIAKDK